MRIYNKTLSDCECFQLQSAFDMTFEITVGLPGGYPKPGKNYPLLLVLDGSLTFATAFETVRAQSGLGGIEEIIVVGIDTPPDEGNAMRGLKRLRYLTPGCPQRGPHIEPVFQLYKEAVDQLGWDFEDTFGGAADFLGFIEKNLMPVLSDRYAVAVDDIGLFGHSAAGAFAAYALFEDSQLLRRYLIGTFGTEWWDDIEAVEKAFVENQKSSSNRVARKVYHAVGGAELDEPAFAQAGIGLPMLERLKDLKLPRIDITTHVFDGEDHASVIPHIIATGIRKLYGTGLGYAEGLTARLENDETASL
jgi:predicted alpha/beta superfamily hydrolase